MNYRRVEGDGGGGSKTYVSWTQQLEYWTCEVGYAYVTHGKDCDRRSSRPIGD